ncbi:MAG TPA: permease-like cell division protein FtsX [Actinomycetota bacterium]|nr:permease-like cell division protein FtsX [Actinomycetota bacterium]
MAIKLDYAVQETITNIRRNGFMTLASVLVVAVSLYLVGGVLLGRFAINRIIELQTRKVEVAVFLSPEVTEDQRTSIHDDLKLMPEVQDVDYESKDEAYERFKEIFRDQPDIVANTDPEALPESFRVKLRNPEQFEIVNDRLEGRPGILRIQDYRSLLKQFFGVVNDIGRIGLVLVVLLSGAAAMIIGTTIRIAIYARRKEIAIMKLVGASNWFIRIPFMLEGVVHGVLGTIAAVVLLLATRPFFIRVADHIRFLHVNVSNMEVLQYGLWLLVGGVVLGALGSLLGLRRFLEV